MTGDEVDKKIKKATYGIEQVNDDMTIHVDVLENGEEVMTIRMRYKRESR